MVAEAEVEAEAVDGGEGMEAVDAVDGAGSRLGAWCVVRGAWCGVSCGCGVVGCGLRRGVR
ncbi:hypothetical protein Shyhy02_02760 [Streptomyces hygroscopicus subsp. hygroscopicus]|nr:hypothetical protein Shyhy02_02760 [Streptomyces hygroscopicus subsp. hygroscopicus]